MTFGVLWFVAWLLISLLVRSNMQQLVKSKQDSARETRERIPVSAVSSDLKFLLQWHKDFAVINIQDSLL